MANCAPLLAAAGADARDRRRSPYPIIHRRRFLFAAGADVQTELPRVHHSASGAAAAPCAAADASSARRLRPSHVWLLDRCVVIADTLEEAAPLFARARARRLPVADLRWLKTMLMRQRYRDPRPAPA